MVEAFIGAGAGILGTLIAAWVAVKARRPVKARVEVVDLAVLYPDADANSGDEDVDNARRELAAVFSTRALFVVLDVKLRNSGGESAYVTELALECSDLLHLRSPAPRDEWGAVLNSMQSSTATYRHGDTSPQRISQVLPPGGTDRFISRVLVAVREEDDGLASCRLRVVLTYNNTETVTSHQNVRAPLLLLNTPHIQSPDEFLTQLRETIRVPSEQGDLPSGYLRECVRVYERRLQQIRTAYAETSHDSGLHLEEPPALQECLDSLPRIRQELGLR
ncbi:hypothetical protein [Streptomyces sp. BBFR102]|uniref:hypothetical protein n=1 Tax=Streptomyces sp. BBFR102 TaxID=3448171 RepID=UPI003F53B633